MSERNIYERVLSTVEHNTNNRVQGPTIPKPIVVRALTRSEFDPHQVRDAIATLVEQGELERTDDGELALAE